MNDAPPRESEAVRVAVIRPGLLDRLKSQSGIASDDAFARAIGVSRATLHRLRQGEEPTLRTIVGIAQAFGLGLGEVVQMSAGADTEAVAS